MDGALNQILEAYGYPDIQKGSPASGYRNTSWPITTRHGVLNLIIYKNEPAIVEIIKRLNAIGLALRKSDLPIRYPVDSRILQIKSGQTYLYSGLYNYLPGQTIPWEAYTMAHLKLLGKALNDLHSEMKHIHLEAPSVTDICLEHVNEMKQYFSNAGVRSALAGKLKITDFSHVFAVFSEKLYEYAKLPNPQLLHMDFVRGNILFEGSREQLHISGILDFEKAATGHPLFDIARTLAFLLVDCKYKSEEKVRKYFLISGYQKRGKAAQKLTNTQEMPLLELLINFFLTYDLYKFMKHNPYESLGQNEHFVRTLTILQQRRIISSVV